MVNWTKFQNKFLSVSGGTATVLLIALILSFFDLIKTEILTAIYLFISLPLVFSFLYTIFANNPDARLRTRKYGSIFYFIIILGVFFYYHPTENLIDTGRLFLSFIIGLIIAMVSGSIYLLVFNLTKKRQYRWRALLGFGISLTVTLIIIFMARQIDFISKAIT